MYESAPVGIDLGTTVSLLARATGDGRTDLVPTRDGGPRLRSIVHVDERGTATVGEAAQRMATVDPESVFDYFKRSMGLPWSVEAGGREWTPQLLSGEVLRALADDAAAAGERPTRAVVTIPAYFGDDARRATQESGALAGLDVVALLHEPTAACLAHDRAATDSRTVLVFDLGGGTFDISVVRLAPGEANVIATLGDHRLGGKDWDDVIVRLLARAFEDASGEDVRDDPVALADLQERARDAKHTLSRLEHATVTLPVDGRLLRCQVTRAEFSEMAADLFARTEDLLTQVLADVGGPSKIDETLLVGGSTRMPQCRQIVERVTGIGPRRGIDPDQAVAAGAALFASRLDGGPQRRGPEVAGASALRVVRDVTAHALGFVVVSANGHRYVNEVMIERNAPIPATATKQHTLEVPRGSDGVLEVHMLQGSAERPLDTQPLGRWTFSGVPLDRKRRAHVDVAFRYDQDGVVRVEAAVKGRPLADPDVDRDDRDISWTDLDPSEVSAAGALDVVLSIDCSGSMMGEPIAAAQGACREFANVLCNKSARVGLVSFTTSYEQASPLTTDAEEIVRATQRLYASGGDDLAVAINGARSLFDGDDARRVIVLLTDGQSEPTRARDAARAAASAGIDIITRGFGNANEALLREIATTDEDPLTSVDGLVGSFRGIAQQLAGTSTPARAGGLRAAFARQHA